jgi:hypothetical protein
VTGGQERDVAARSNSISVMTRPSSPKRSATASTARGNGYARKQERDAPNRIRVPTSAGVWIPASAAMHHDESRPQTPPEVDKGLRLPVLNKIWLFFAYLPSYVLCSALKSNFSISRNACVTRPICSLVSLPTRVDRKGQFSLPFFGVHFLLP